MFGRGHMDVSDASRAFAQLLYSENSTRATGSDPPMLGGWRTPIPHGNGIYGPSVARGRQTRTLDYHAPEESIGLELRAGGRVHEVAGMADAAAADRVARQPAEPGSRFRRRAVGGVGRLTPQLRRHELSCRSSAGSRASFAFKDWTWEAYASQGSTRVVNIYNGATSLARWRFVQAQPNYGKGLFYTGNEYGGGFGAGTITCTSGIISVYGVNGWTEGDVPSEDCQKAVTMQPKATGEMKQTVMEYNMQGSMAEMPARRHALCGRRVDPRQQVRVLPRPDEHAGVRARLSREPFSRSARPSARRKSARSTASCWCRCWPTRRAFQSLNLELGYRTTDNDPSEDDDTYKALIDWTIVDRVRFRGGRQIANRAPNIGELFQASEQFAPFTFVQGDPCSTRDPAQLPYTANAGHQRHRACERK